MASYVLYCLDGIRLVRDERFEADDDASAIHRSKLFQRDNAAELWCEGRRVKVFASIKYAPAHPQASLSLPS